MRLCFILEQQYQDDRMPRAVADCVRELGHVADLLEPHRRLTELGSPGAHEYDAYVLKTAPDGPGLTILEAAEAQGMPTINSCRSIRLVRDKAVAVAVAAEAGLRMPRTYFASTPGLIRHIDPRQYPLVIKPNGGSSGQGVHRVDHPDQLRQLELAGHRHLLVQSYIENAGFDVKLYHTGQELFAVRRPSPLHPDLPVRSQLLKMTPQLRDIGLAFARAFDLKIFGVDLLPTRDGWIAVDVNDFPSFHEVPDAAARLAASVLKMARAARRATGGWRRKLWPALVGEWGVMSPAQAPIANTIQPLPVERPSL